MNSDRLVQLQKMLEQEPDDPFLRYAIATEYLGTEPEKAYHLYSQLLNDSPDYLPTYYQAAHLAEELGHLENAEQLLNQGIALAGKQGNMKIKAELQAALDQLLFE